MRFAMVIGLILSALAGSVHAQDIRWMPETMTPGDYVTIDQSDGGLIHHVYAGQVGGSYVLQSFRGSAPGGEPVFTTYLDRDGNYLRWVWNDGFEVVYTPHDCTRTLGRCQYAQVGSDGVREVRLRITQATRRGFEFQEYDVDGQRLFGGWIELDARGMAGDGRLDGLRGKQRFRLVRQRYQ
ncbi:MAG: hypothetical protein AAF376_15025 [Pseudomonadota bacterium]